MQARLSYRTTGALFAGCMYAALVFTPHASAQVAPADPRMDPNTIPSSSGRGTDPSGISNASPEMSMEPNFARETLQRREAARKVERKKRMVDSANRLLELTQQLRAELATREATPADEKRLDEIAKLARSVKDQMRE